MPVDLTAIRALLRLLKTHGETLTNGGEDPPEHEETLDADGEIRGWDIWVADGQVCAFVPYMPHSSGESSDGGPLTDWRDAICAAGGLMLEAHAHLTAATAEIERLRAERERLLAWLAKIEGGDNPAGGVEDLRQWAWKAGMGSEVDDG